MYFFTLYYEGLPIFLKMLLFLSTKYLIDCNSGKMTSGMKTGKLKRHC